MSTDKGPLAGKPARSAAVPIVIGLIGVGALVCGGWYYWEVWRRQGAVGAPTVQPAGWPALSAAKGLFGDAADLFAKGRTDEATAKANEALAKAEQVLREVPPTHPFGLSARTVQGGAHRLLGHKDEALKLLEALLAEKALSPVDGKAPAESEVMVDAQFEWAMVLAKTNRHDEGLDALNRSSNLKGLPNNAGHKARMGIAEVHEQMGEFDQARAMYERIIAKHEGPEKSWAKQASMRLEILDKKIPAGKPAEDPKAKKVSGVLDGRHVWTKAEGPYQVDATVRVPAGSRLEIGPGVLVRFASKSRLEVAGTLVARGEPGEAGEIRLTAQSGLLGAFGWDGVEFVGSPGKEESALTHCRIDSARVGVRIRGAAPEIADCRITGCGTAGVQVQPAPSGSEGPEAATAAPPAARLLRVTMDAGLGSGAEIQGAVAPMLKECTLEKNRECGIVVQDGAAPEIADCRIRANREDGVAFRKRGRGRIVGNTVIEKNEGLGVRSDFRCEPEVVAATIRANGEGGVAVAASQAVLTDCTISDNGGVGVTFGLDAAGTVTGNKILGNAGVGVLLDSGAKKVAVRNNRISGQDLGVVIRDAADPAVAANDLSGNKRFALSVETGNFVDAGDNFWGAATAEEIRKLIKGSAKFEPFRTKP